MDKQKGAIRLLAGLGTAVLVAAMSGGHAQAATAAAGNKAFSGYSHDIKTYVAGVVTSGPVVAAGVGCSDTAPLFYQDGAANVALARVTLGTDVTSSQALKSGTVQENRSTFQASGVSIPLGTLTLTADAITITASTTYDTSTGAFVTSPSMSVTNLNVGLPLAPPTIHINGVVAPNTGFTFPLVGSILLNATQVLGKQSSGAVGLMATALKVDLLASTAKVSVGETYASIYGSTDQVWMFGEGQGLTVATSDALLRVGPLVRANLPCFGNGGNTSTVLGTNGLPAALGSIGAVTSTATGTRTGPNGDATTTSQVAAVNLLGGLVTADAIGSTSHVTTADGGATVNKAGSGSVLTNLTVAGIAVNPNPAPNTKINLPGIGYVIVNAQTNFAQGIEMIPLVVHVNAGSPLGLPALDILVARSYALIIGPGTTSAAAGQATTFLKNGTAKSKLLTGKQKAVSAPAAPAPGKIPGNK